MSKSKGNYIGVTDEPNDMFGKVMSISDDMMENYFTLLTNTAPAKVTELVNPDVTHPKQAKVMLGKAIVTDFYDEAAADCAAAEFDKVFAQGQLPDEIPEVQISPESIPAGKLLLACKLVSSGGEAKRMIKQAAVTIDAEKIDDPNRQIAPADGMVVQVGKRKFVRLKVQP